MTNQWPRVVMRWMVESEGKRSRRSKPANMYVGLLEGRRESSVSLLWMMMPFTLMHSLPLVGTTARTCRKLLNRSARARTRLALCRITATHFWHSFLQSGHVAEDALFSSRCDRHVSKTDAQTVPILSSINPRSCMSQDVSRKSGLCVSTIRQN